MNCFAINGGDTAGITRNELGGWYSGDNARLFRLMSIFLNLAPDYIEADMIDGIAGDLASRSEKDTVFAYASVAAAACGLDVWENREDRRFFGERFLPMFALMDTAPFKADPYYRNIAFPDGEEGGWRFETRTCRPYEAFVRGDPEVSRGRDGKILVTPRIGFFTGEYRYPAVTENGREWMTLMPNETLTSAYAVERSRGRVLTFGLGLGYFTYMAARKPEVESVTVVERDPSVIDLFRRHILPQFPDAGKVSLVTGDAFEYAENVMPAGGFDTVFCDIWHDPSDGVPLYLRMKEIASRTPGPEYIYWIEDTLRLYI